MEFPHGAYCYFALVHYCMRYMCTLSSVLYDSSCCQGIYFTIFERMAQKSIVKRYAGPFWVYGKILTGAWFELNRMAPYPCLTSERDVVLQMLHVAHDTSEDARLHKVPDHLINGMVNHYFTSNCLSQAVADVLHPESAERVQDWLRNTNQSGLSLAIYFW